MLDTLWLRVESENVKVRPKSESRGIVSCMESDSTNPPLGSYTNYIFRKGTITLRSITFELAVSLDIRARL